MKVLDLFSGLGMFSYAARNVFQENFKSAGFVEIDKYCQKQILDFFEGATFLKTISYEGLFMISQSQIEIPVLFDSHDKCDITCTD